jgi:hypothetical protein
MNTPSDWFAGARAIVERQQQLLAEAACGMAAHDEHETVTARHWLCPRWLQWLIARIAPSVPQTPAPLKEPSPGSTPCGCLFVRRCTAETREKHFPRAA